MAVSRRWRIVVEFDDYAEADRVGRLLREQTTATRYVFDALDENGEPLWSEPVEWLQPPQTLAPPAAET